MVSFTREKAVIDALSEGEKHRLLCMFMSPKDGASEFKFDWAAAAERYGAGSAASMRVNSAKVLNKVKIQEDGSAPDAAGDDAETVAKATEKKTPAKNTATTKRKKVDEEAEDSEGTQKKKRAPKKKKKETAPERHEEA